MLSISSYRVVNNIRNSSIEIVPRISKPLEQPRWFGNYNLFIEI